MNHHDAAQIVHQHLDQIATTDEERHIVLKVCEEREGVTLLDWANSLTRAHTFNGVHQSPGVARHHDRYGEYNLPLLDPIRRTIKLGEDRHGTALEMIEQRIYDPPQQIHNVLLLKRHGFVVIDGDDELFVMTEAEYNAQMGGK